METPFDKTLVYLEDKRLSNPAKGSWEKYTGLFTFFMVCRSRYIQMIEATEKNRRKMKEIFSHESGLREMSYEEHIEQETISLDAKLSYFSFLEELHRYGRVLRNELGITIPLLHRISFYRNKAIEHWDDCEPIAASGIAWIGNKIAIPHFYGDINVPKETPKSFKKLKELFQLHGITIKEIDGPKVHEEYSEEMFTNLEMIDPGLRTERRTRIIDDDLINALFKFCFPTPINSIENYSAKIVNDVMNKLNQTSFFK